jgi:hypothetical protein
VVHDTGQLLAHSLMRIASFTDDDMKWKEQLNADCPKRGARLHERYKVTCRNAVPGANAACPHHPARICSGAMRSLCR